MKNKLITIMAVIIMVLSSSYGNYEVVKAYDETDTDVIHNYEITVDVNDDATINIKYHIEWEVLESDENGPVEWVQIGIPNDDVISYEALSDNIDYIEIEEEGGSFADIYFDGEYYEDDVISFDFVIVQDSMYMVEQEGIDYNNSEDYDDRDKEGATDVMTEEAQGEESNMTEDFKNLEGKVTYFFTPGWFDEIEVEKLTIRWNSEKVMNSFPNSKNKDGYLVWKTALSYGEQYDIRIVYDINAYEFDLSFTSYPNQYDSDYDDDYYDNNYYEKNDDSFSVIVGVLFSTIIFIGVFAFRVFMGIADYRIDSGFGSTTKTKITRQKITYYENCP
ncbi:MAG: hypothetical protein IKN54_09765, partial [Lachnospiraceae bacterium]|nr:hypothetical protein [Lachnospiraceae bacterium]